MTRRHCGIKNELHTFKIVTNAAAFINFVWDAVTHAVVPACHRRMQVRAVSSCAVDGTKLDESIWDCYS